MLIEHNSDALLLKARYAQAKKQINMGMIDKKEWDSVASKVNTAALEMASIQENKSGPVQALSDLYDYIESWQIKHNRIGYIEFMEHPSIQAALDIIGENSARG